MSSSAQSQDPQEEGFFTHLTELRSRLIRAGLSVFVIFILLCIWPGTSRVYDVLAAPMISTLPPGHTMIATGVITPFMVPIKVTFLLAFVIALPYVLYQFWAFIAPGLYKHEKRLVLPLVFSSTILFIVGMAFCYFVVFRSVFHFVNMVAPSSITMAPDIEAYLSFVMTMFIVFGMTFEVPVVVMVLVSLGIVELQTMRKARGYVIVGSFVVAAIVTPPDVMSQLMMAIPLCVLYEVGLIVSRFLRVQAKQTLDSDQH
ncbi:twin-arginine translocase subunit TatC [Brackiella oedipodis]|uniref:twin-arginine translocase subunit TatC n=1 Tax=Brackiella oedipodis TaxID=124225 RepID=UPI000490350B|nr:twin-arginine translocase subunit TatC [Brackiella oedipodis]